MANIKMIATDGTTKYIKATGTGTDLDPFVSETSAISGVDIEGGAMAVHVVDVHDKAVNIPFHQHDSVVSTLAIATSIGDTSITLVDGTGFTAGMTVALKISATDDGRIYTVTGVATNVLTLDQPIDKVFAIGSEVDYIVLNLGAQIGSLAAPQAYLIKPPAGEIWHITRFIIQMTHDTAANLGSFGDQTALTYGVLGRIVINSIPFNFVNWKSNADIKQTMFDLEFTDRGAPGSPYGTSGRFTISKLGVAIKLNGDSDDYLEILIQDDLTGLDSFGINAQGHVA